MSNNQFILSFSIHFLDFNKIILHIILKEKFMVNHIKITYHEDIVTL